MITCRNLRGTRNEVTMLQETGDCLSLKVLWIAEASTCIWEKYTWSGSSHIPSTHMRIPTEPFLSSFGEESSAYAWCRCQISTVKHLLNKAHRTNIFVSEFHPSNGCKCKVSANTTPRMTYVQFETSIDHYKHMHMENTKGCTWKRVLHNGVGNLSTPQSKHFHNFQTWFTERATCAGNC